MKQYIPPRERRVYRRLKFSSVGFAVSIMLALSIISLISAAQSVWYQQPIQAQENLAPEYDVISDNIVASKEVTPVVLAEAPAIQSPQVDLSTLPLEKTWPVRGRLTTYFSNYHPAIDIAINRGTPIYAYASGVVVEAGYSGGFGKRVIISHNNGYQTLYAHMNTIDVTLGQSVDPSTVIGTVGSTGRSTGPHLHFQVTQNGRFLNPLLVLP